MNDSPQFSKSTWQTGVLLILTLGLAGFAVIPTYQTHQRLVAEQQDLSRNSPQVLQLLPMSKDPQLTDLQNKLTNQIIEDSNQANVVVQQLTVALKHRGTMDAMPVQIEKVPVTLTVQGSFSALHDFQKRLMTHSPYLAFHSLDIRNIDTTSVQPGESPVLQSILRFDVILFSPHM